MRKIIIMPCLLIENDKIISKSSIEDVEDKGDILETARYYSDNSADELMFINKTENDLEKDKLIRLIKEVTGRIEIPLLVYIHVKKFEDAKKAFYAGANKVMFDEKHSGKDVADEITKRFGEERVVINKGNNPTINETIPDNLEDIFNLISEKDDTDIYLTAYDFGNVNIMELKYFLKQKGLQIDIFESKLEFSDFKLNKDGMLPVITQDYKTNEVLQLAYMTEEAFNNTLKSGKMTYYSRSRSELWVKGETSGHFQYVKSLTADCDKDTLLAKVSQVGAACHTGEKSCFFNTIAKKDYTVSNPLKVFEDEYKIIIDRKQNPKEGSYTTYLFKKGLDKILKKLGEEATEIVIAAKNNNTEELKYEIADFLYHMTVLMVDKGLDWKDITDELIDRR